MKEIIKIERFLDSIIQNVWRNNDSKHHKTNYSLYSDFGNYPDLNDFETELLTVDRELIDDKIKNIKEKCNELIEFYDIKISNLPIGNGTVTIGKLNLNPIDLKYNEAENTASITIEVYEKIENNSKLTVLLFDDNDLINTIEKIKAIVDQPKPENKKSFADYLICDDKDKIIKKISKANRSTPQSIYFILKALFDNELLVITNNETIYKAYHAEFGYHKGYETLKRGLNHYDIDKPDTKNQQKIGNMYEYLTS